MGIKRDPTWGSDHGAGQAAAHDDRKQLNALVGLLRPVYGETIAEHIARVSAEIASLPVGAANLRAVESVRRTVFKVVGPLHSVFCSAQMPTALQLVRCGRPVFSFVSALGRTKETRLTATLAFLVARFPDQFLPIFKCPPGHSERVVIEESAEGDRLDIVIRGDHEPIVIEGKLGLRQDPQQLQRYVRRQRAEARRRPTLAVVDSGSEMVDGLSVETRALGRLVRRIVRVRWSEVAVACGRVAKSRRLAKDDPVGAAIAADLELHLQENNMVNTDRGEIYVRELSDVGSVELYFKYHLYRCDPKFVRSAQGNLYFAPYFTRAASDRISERNLVPVGEGICFVSRIAEVQTLPKSEVAAYLRRCGMKDARDAAKLVVKGHLGRELLLIRMGPPQRLLLSPVTKRQLGYGAGALGARTCTLEDLLVGGSANSKRGVAAKKKRSARKV